MNLVKVVNETFANNHEVTSWLHQVRQSFAALHKLYYDSTPVVNSSVCSPHLALRRFYLWS